MRHKEQGILESGRRGSKVQIGSLVKVGDAKFLILPRLGSEDERRTVNGSEIRRR